MSTATTTAAGAMSVRKRPPRRRRPFPAINGWSCGADFPADWPPSIVFPDPADGWSPLCVRIIEKACLFAVEAIEGEVDIREWGGPVPGLQRDDLMIAAYQVLNDDRLDEIPFAAALAALVEAHRFVGFRN